MRVKLEDSVYREAKVRVCVKGELWAEKCTSCSKIFHMKEFCGEQLLGVLTGMFAESVVDPATRRSLGNSFRTMVCSFACAHEIFAQGGWRRIEKYKAFANADIPLVRCELKITSNVVGESQLRREWEEHSTRVSNPIILSRGPYQGSPAEIIDSLDKE